MENLISLIAFGLALIIAFVSGEIKSFRTSSIFLAAYGIIIAALLGLESLGTGIVALAVTAIAIPALIQWISGVTKITVEPPSSGIMAKAPFALIMGILALLVMYNIGVLSFESISGVTLLAYGLVILISKNNLVKFIIGLVYMHTGAALATAPLYPAGSSAASFEIAYFLLLAGLVSLISYFTVSVFRKSGTILSRDLTKLRW